jgi:hypothetical protein
VLPQRSQRVKAVAVGHAQVQQDHVGAQRLGQDHAFGPIGRLAHHLDVILHIEEGAQALPDDLVVVDDKNLDAASQGTAPPPVP